MVFAFCGVAFGVDSDISWIPGDNPPDFSRTPADPTTDETISFTIPTDVYANQWQAEQALGGTPTLIIDPAEKRIDLQFVPPAPADPIPVTDEPVSGLQGSFGPLEEGSWLFFVQFQGVIHIDPFFVGPSVGAPPANDSFTEHFTSDADAFDLTFQSVLFSPILGGTSYSAEIQQISQLPTDPAGGVNLGLGDDAFKFVKLASMASVSIYGSPFTGFYVGSNGYITFSEGDDDYSESLQDHFDTLRVSGLFRDLNPPGGGQVSWRQLSNRVAVTWENVPEYGTNNSNTFQIVLFYDGSIQISWAGVGALRGIVGLSRGLGVPPDFQETDFSELSAPPPPPVPVSKHPVEQFTSGSDLFDLSNMSVTFDPAGGGTSYGAAIRQISKLPTEPTGGINLALGDDDSKFVKLASPSMVSLYGNSFTGIYVGSNGYITFTEGDDDYSESLQDHFSTLRVSGLFRDLNPSGGGIVSWKQLSNRVAVTWENVPEYGTNNANTFQIELFFDGVIQISWLEVAATGGIVGLSNGAGLPSGFQETDLSELSAEPPPPPPPPPATDFLTEEFSGDADTFDLANTSVTFTPTADGTSYTGSLQNITQLPTNPSGGTNLGLRDDNFVPVGLSSQARVRIFNQQFSTFFVGSNGYITFTRGDQDFSQTLAEHFDRPRISGLYCDLTAARTGTVTARQLTNRVAVTWQGVPEFSSTAPNTFQIEMFYDGRIRLSWLEIGSDNNIVGLSNGLGVPPAFDETDFSVEYAQP